MNEMMRKWAALAVILVAMLAADLALGEDQEPCYQAYRESGLTAQQMTFDHFHHFYADTLCSPEGHDLQAAREGRGVGVTRGAGEKQQSTPPEIQKER
jgi:hypothetical protein